MIEGIFLVLFIENKKEILQTGAVDIYTYTFDTFFSLFIWQEA